MQNKTYIAIDLKSFYASVECRERDLDPLTANLVVADESKTEKTICLAVTPALKKYGLSGRSRLYHVIQKVDEINRERKKAIGWKNFTGKSINEVELEKDPFLELDYIAAPPRMAYYIEYSTRIVEIYLKYVSEEDMHVYSVDEVFMDATKYLKANKMGPMEFAKTIIKDVYQSTGITATAGVGTNMYLCKIAMDIGAKHISPDEDGARIAYLDEKLYRKHLWGHTPITDFWRIGSGYANRLSKLGLYTMGDVANCSVGDRNSFYNEKLLYDTFGINAELLIDHAWGYESATIKDIKGYKPERRSISNGQVLTRPYSFKEAKTILKEMIYILSLDLVKKGYVTNHLTIYVGYDVENVKNGFKGDVTTDFYGRKLPKKSRGSINLDYRTTSAKYMTNKTLEWFNKNVNKNLTIRRFSISADNIIDEKYEETDYDLQINFLEDSPQNQIIIKEQEKEFLEKEKRLQKATLEIQKKFGKNAILKGLNLEEESTYIERNNSIGGHKA
ncbi:Y-family DNA polymerase [Helcococcus kunzii]